MACAGQGTLGSHTTSKLAFGHFRSPTTFLLTPATYPHSTNTHYIQYALWALSFSYVWKYFFKVLHSHTKALKWRTLERATSHIKVKHPSCLLGLLPWENVHKSKTLNNSTWVSSSYELFMRNCVIHQLTVSYYKTAQLWYPVQQLEICLLDR